MVSVGSLFGAQRVFISPTLKNRMSRAVAENSDTEYAMSMFLGANWRLSKSLPPDTEHWIWG